MAPNCRFSVPRLLCRSLPGPVLPWPSLKSSRLNGEVSARHHYQQFTHRLEIKSGENQHFSCLRSLLPNGNCSCDVRNPLTGWYRRVDMCAFYGGQLTKMRLCQLTSPVTSRPSKNGGRLFFLRGRRAQNKGTNRPSHETNQLDSS